MVSRTLDVQRVLSDIQRMAATWRSGALSPGDRDSLVNEYVSRLTDLREAGWKELLGWRHELPDTLLPEWYLTRRADRIDTLERHLAQFAEGWGRSRDIPSQRASYYEAYVSTMEDLFRIGHWSGEPDAESHLPYDLMPKVYRDFWEINQGHWTP